MFYKIYTSAPPVLYFSVRISVSFKMRFRVKFDVNVYYVRVKDMVMLGMAFRVKVWFYLLIQ